MVGPWMVRRQLHGCLQRRQDLRRPGLGGALLRPEIPGVQVHQRLGQQRDSAGVVGVATGDPAHGFGIGHVERRTVFDGFGRVPLREGLDERPFLVVGPVGQREGLLKRLVGLGHVLVFHRRVDVRPQHQRHAPVTHGARRIEPGRLTERALGLSVVESIGQNHCLVEETLRPRDIGRDRNVIVAEAFEQRSHLLVVLRMGLTHQEGRNTQRTEDQQAE